MQEFSCIKIHSTNSLSNIIETVYMSSNIQHSQ